jgi:signal transduction histidine kinase
VPSGDPSSASEADAPAEPASGRQDWTLERERFADLFARISHDLRSPLGVLAQVVQRLEADLAPHLTDEHRVLLKLGNRGLLRLTNFVERMRLLAELEGGRLELSRQLLDLVAVVRRGVDATLAAEPRREVAVSFEPPSFACRVDGDPRLLSHAVSELVSNAVIHARRRVQVSLAVQGGEASVSVEDDGEGVSEPARRTLFRRFAGASRAGLGIGLSLADEIARAHGGHIELGASTLPPGRPNTVGARFTVTLPLDGPSGGG